MSNTVFDVVELREALHKIPELACHETKTSNFIAEHLEQIGLKPIRGIATTGVVAYIEGEEPGPTVLLRVDMDALPFKIDGKDVAIHACGHDSHTAMGLAVASRLVGKVKKGKVKLFFQPAEETLEGAKRAIEDGVLDDVDIAFGAHVRPIQDIPDGTVCPSVKYTATAFCNVYLKGKTAHGSRPHLARSTVEAAVLSANAINSIWMNPAKSWSCKVTAIECPSTSPNIISDKGKLVLDIRAQDNPTMDELIEKTKRAVDGACRAVDVEYEFDFPQGVTPAPEYDPAMVQQARETIVEVLGKEKLAEPCAGGGEDFNYFVKAKPGLPNTYLGIGTGVCPGLHDPTMTMNAESLRNGVDVLEKLILKQVS